MESEDFVSILALGTEDYDGNVIFLPNLESGSDAIQSGHHDVVVEAMKKAVDEMSEPQSFRGYGPEQGYQFLIEKIIENDFKPRGVELTVDEVFVSDGSKNDTANFQELFGINNVLAVTDPVYPVYVDSNVMAGRTGGVNEKGHFDKIVYLPCTEENGMKPALPQTKVDMIYLCFPNNPSGMTLSKVELKQWVDYAKENKSIILFDAAYEAFIQEEGVPRSIYEVEGVREVAVEFRVSPRPPASPVPVVLLL